MTDAAHCDDEATIVALKRRWGCISEGRSLEDRKEKAEPFQAKDFIIMRRAMSFA